jgi:hypothetical protein
MFKKLLGITLVTGLLSLGIIGGTIIVNSNSSDDDWWSPKDSPCSFYKTKEECEKYTKKTCVKHTGPRPACLTNIK